MLHTGTVHWFNLKKGYGFVKPDNGKKDVFIHISALKSAGIDKLDDGQRIEYKISINKDKESATDIKKV